MHKYIFLLAFVTGATGPAVAACPSSMQTILSCTFSNGKKVLDTCQNGEFATYAFGKVNKKPEMYLETPMRGLNYTPWNGIGRAIYEQVIFRNEDISYVVWSGFERDPGMIDPLRAGIVVEDQNENVLAELRCDIGSVRAEIDGLYDAKSNLNMCWDYNDFQWQNCQ